VSERLTVAIVGAGGFIGSRFAEWLVLRDLASVRPIVRSFRGLGRLARFRLDCRIADATDQISLERQLKDCHVVCHCVVGSRETILGSIEAVYRAASAAAVRRLVYLSSAVVHGNNPPTGTTDDTELLRTQPFEYNVSKVLAEWRLNALRQDGKVETVVLRPSIVFGPRSYWWTAQIADAVLSKTAYLIDEGEGICNTIYVDNLVHAMWLAATQPAAANQAFLLTDGERVTWRDLYGSVAAALAVDPSGITSVSAADARTALRRSVRRQKLVRLDQTPWGGLLKAVLPRSVKHALRKSYASPPAMQREALKDRPLALDPEIASLQQCQVVLPIDKARAILGYEPVTGFQEGSRRTGAWLRFALGVPHGAPAGPCTRR
jgi:nucleoside-diphosphate-sugar epimerase